MADQAEELRKMFNGTYVCPHCGQDISAKPKTNHDYARESLAKFRDREDINETRSVWRSPSTA